MATRRTPRQLLDQALDWVRETGWPSLEQDWGIAKRIYDHWISETNAEWIRTCTRDRERLSDAIEAAFRPIRDDRSADAIYVLMMLELELRARREGVLRQGLGDN